MSLRAAGVRQMEEMTEAGLEEEQVESPQDHHSSHKCVFSKCLECGPCSYDCLRRDIYKDIVCSNGLTTHTSIPAEHLSCSPLCLQENKTEYEETCLTSECSYLTTTTPAPVE